MKQPEFNDQQLKMVDSMVRYWDDMENMEKYQRLQTASSEVGNLVRMLPAITILRMVADCHHRNKSLTKVDDNTCTGK